MSERWCIVCGSDHLEAEECPGDGMPSEPEHQGVKINAETPEGVQGIGVLLAPIGPRWRARVISFPRTLWTVPGGRSTMKFYGRTADAAERKAVTFIRAHCIARGFVLRDELAPMVEAPLGQPDGARPAVRGGHRGVERRVVEPRFPRRLPLVFGRDRPTMRAMSGNLSKTGLFVQTERPIDEGELVGVMLELEHAKVPLRGSVIWRRHDDAPGRPCGMGVQLLNPPRIYTSYIDALA